MKQNQERPGVMMYFHLLEPMRCLSREQFADMIWALMDYAHYGVLPEFADPLMAVSWGYLQHAADVDLERYELRKQRAIKGANKRWHPQAMLNNANDAIYNTEAISDSDTETNPTADADAYPTASASAEAEPQTEPAAESPGVPPAVVMEPLATPREMANSPSWQKMVQASHLRREGEAHEAWREAQIAAFTRQNEELRAAARAKNLETCS